MTDYPPGFLTGNTKEMTTEELAVLSLDTTAMMWRALAVQAFCGKGQEAGARDELLTVRRIALQVCSEIPDDFTEPLIEPLQVSKKYLDRLGIVEDTH